MLSVICFVQVLHFLKANGMEVPVAGQRGEEGTYVGSSSALVMNNLTALAHLSCQRYFEDGKLYFHNYFSSLCIELLMNCLMCYYVCTCM